MTPYTALYDDVMPELPGADLAVVLHQIKRTCNDFYERSLYARETLVPIDVVQGTATYTPIVSDPADFEIGKILGVRFNNGSAAGPVKLQSRTKHQLNIEVPNWDTRQGNPVYYTQGDIASVTLVYVPDAGYVGGLIITIAKLPIYLGVGIDTNIFEKFSEAIGAGIKQRMMRMAKKPWSNPPMALEYGKFFESEVSAAAVIAGRSFGSAPLRSRSYG